MQTRLDAAHVLLTGAALTDGSGPVLRQGAALLIEGGVLAGLWDDDERPDVGDAEEVDASGATVVPGLVDAHQGSERDGRGEPPRVDR
jgi:imidazolonepropionase-like amidohydrolase